jgi:hypothetical protein
MQTEMKVKQIIDMCFEDSTFRDDLVSGDIEVQKTALEGNFPDIFPDTEEGRDRRDQALAALNRILDSPCRDALLEFTRQADISVEYAP